jgi:PKD repeat protein
MKMNKISKLIGLTGIVASLYTGCADKPTTPIGNTGGSSNMNMPPTITSLTAMPETTSVAKPVVFIATGNDNERCINRIEWDYGDGSKQNQYFSTARETETSTETHVYTKPGNYEARATVYDGVEQAGTQNIFIKVEDDTKN